MLPPVTIPNCRMVPGCKAASPCKRGRMKEEGEACSRPWLPSQAVGRHQAVRWLLTGLGDKKGAMLTSTAIPQAAGQSHGLLFTNGKPPGDTVAHAGTPGKGGSRSEQ